MTLIEKLEERARQLKVWKRVDSRFEYDQLEYDQQAADDRELMEEAASQLRLLGQCKAFVEVAMRRQNVRLVP